MVLVAWARTVGKWSLRRSIADWIRPLRMWSLISTCAHVDKISTSACNGQRADVPRLTRTSLSCFLLSVGHASSSSSSSYLSAPFPSPFTAIPVAFLDSHSPCPSSCTASCISSSASSSSSPSGSNGPAAASTNVSSSVPRVHQWLIELHPTRTRTAPSRGCVSLADIALKTLRSRPLL